jgi:hypothetical protein
MKLRVAIADVEVENAKQLVELFQQFQAGKTRFCGVSASHAR